MSLCLFVWLVLLVEETGGPKTEHRPLASQWQTLLHNVVQLALVEIRTHNSIGDRQFVWLFLNKTCNLSYRIVQKRCVTDFRLWSVFRVYVYSTSVAFCISMVCIDKIVAKQLDFRFVNKIWLKTFIEKWTHISIWILSISE